MGNRSRSSFLPFFSSPLPKARIASNRVYCLFIIVVALIFSYSFYTLYIYKPPTQPRAPKLPRPPLQPFVDFQRSFGYKKTLMQHGVADLCKETEWKKDVYLDCYTRVGTCNAINFVQTCFREAIDAGFGIVRPKIYTRDTVNISILDGPLVDIDHFMDEEHLWKSLELSCPQLKVVEPDFKQTAKMVEFGGEFNPNIYHRGEFKTFIHKLFEKEISLSSSSSPLVIRHKYNLLQWHVNSDPLLFQIGFRDMFQLHPRFLKVANLLLDKLPYDFIGVHLRVESDFIEIDKIEEELLEIVDDANLDNPVIYLASGQVNRTLYFRKIANEKGVKVVDKWDIMDKQIKKEMEDMDFDQIAVLDFIVLHHSQYFKGSGLSSFSFYLNLSRYFYQFGTLFYDPAQQLGRQTQITDWFIYQFINAMW